MFDSIGWGEIVVLALAALFIFGPDRLPDLAKDAAAGLKKVRTAITGVRARMWARMNIFCPMICPFCSMTKFSSGTNAGSDRS